MSSNSGIANLAIRVTGGNDFADNRPLDGVTLLSEVDSLYYSGVFNLESCSSFSFHLKVADVGAGQNYRYDCQLSNNGVDWITFIGSSSKVGSGATEIVYDSFNNKNGLSYKYARLFFYPLAASTPIAPKVLFNLKVNE